MACCSHANAAVATAPARCSPVERDQPNRSLVRRGGADTVPNTSFDLEPIPRAQRDRAPVVELELGVALHQLHELMIRLVVPKPIWRGLPLRHDALDTH